MALTFVVLFFVYWQMSGGGDFEPETRAAADVGAVEEITARTASEPARDTAVVLTTTESPDATPPTSEDPAATEVATAEEAPLSDAEATADAVTDTLAGLDATPPAESESDAGSDVPGLVTADLSFTSLSESEDGAAQPAATEAPVTAEAPVAEPQPAADIRQVAGTRVNMRQGPGTNFAVMDTLDGGTEVEVLEVSDNGWARLRIAETGEIGWMAERLLTDG